MSGKNPAPSQFAPVTLASSGGLSSRRDSNASASVKSTQADKDQLAQALDKIHTSANQCDVLTTFNDLAPPPDSTASPENKGFTGELVQNGLSGLYSRFKEAVVAVGTGKTSGQDDADSQEVASRKSSSTAATASRGSLVSVPRADTGLTSSTANSSRSDQAISTVLSSGALTSEGLSQQPLSTKASSVSKSAASSRQNIPNMTKATATVTAVTVGVSGRGKASHVEDSSNRSSSGRKSISRTPDLHFGSQPTDLSDSRGAASIASLEKVVVPNRSRRDDVLSNDGNMDSPTSPVKGSVASAAASSHSISQDASLLSPIPRSGARDPIGKPAVIDRISRFRASAHSRSSSLSQGTAEPSIITTSAHYPVHHNNFGRDDALVRMKSGAYRIPGTTSYEGAPEMVNATLEHMRKQVLSKDFWMADETCKECFLCAAPFSAFRRKHHCRTCGCIFDSRCTSIISGARFGVQGTLRVCKPCLNIISQREDANASDDSADDSYLPAIFRPQPKPGLLNMAGNEKDDASISERNEDMEDDNRSLSAPMMAIPATRRIGESSNRHSAVLEIDAPQLSRPGSSRSLKSLAGRPHSASHGHRRQHSKHNFLSRFKASPSLPAPDDRAPFRRSANEEVAKKSGLPAFHADNVIDPDLAPFMSDESSGDEQMSIFQTMASDELKPASFDHDKSSFGSYLGAGRRNRHRGEKSISGLSFTSRGFDDGNGALMHPRSSRRRNMSTASASAHHLRSPRPRSATLRAGPSASTETLPFYDNALPNSPPRLMRSSSLRGEKEPRVELHPASISHVRKLLHQLLEDDEVPNISAWEKALMPVLLKCTTSVDPDVENGDHMDIRHYVKLKKIPGGRPGDTSYVSGVIFTKKLALKSMPRRMTAPRVVIISFPIVYQRRQPHFISLKPVIDEEKEFLRMLVNRIIALRPQLVLCERSVSGIALQFLSEARIAVAYNVKGSVISAVSRCLETPIITSIDMLSFPPGRAFPCGKSNGYEVKTFVAEKNEKGEVKKKTYIFLASNNEQLGCTIALRGASTDTLAKIKRITEFMIYVVYNLKLESCLMRDSYLQVPTSEEMAATPGQAADGSLTSLNTLSSGAPGPRQRTLSTMTLDESLQTTQDTGENSGAGTAASVAADSGLSLALQRTSKLIALHENHARESHDSLLPDDVPMPTFYSDMVAKYQTKVLSASPFVKFPQPYLLMKAREQERRLAYLKKLRDQDIIEERADGEKPKPQKFQLIKPHMVHEIGQKAPRQIMEVLHAVHDAEYDKALYNYQIHTRQWENNIQWNLDIFDPYSHQNIVVLHSVVCIETKVPCVEPELQAIPFYDEHAEHNGKLVSDMTLGQFVEHHCLSADSICLGNSCDRKMCEHHLTYVHGEGRITVFVEQDTKGKFRDNIMMWSFCKVCKRETAEMEMSKGTWKYSFAKYLELSFWSRGTTLVKSEDPNEWECSHDHHRDHIRYFGFEDKVMRVHYDPIDLLEIIVPRARITWKVEHDLNLKNDIFTSCSERWTRFTTSVKARLKAIKLDNIPADKAEACRAEIDRMTKKLQDEHVALIRRLQDAYMNSKYYEVIPLNVTLREMLEKVTEWDAAFAQFEADFLPTEKDIRRLTMLQLRKMFMDESKESLSSNDATTDTADTTERTSQTTTFDGDAKNSTQPTDTDISQPDSHAEKSPLEATQELTTPLVESVLERVEPLDLATPQPPTPSMTNSSQTVSLATSPTILETPGLIPSLSQTPNSPTTADQLVQQAPQMSVTEQVEQLRRRQQSAVLETASGANTSGSESTRNRPEPPPRMTIPDRVSSRRAGMNVSPPMARALSQPANGIPTIARSQPNVLKKTLGLSKEKDKTLAAEVAPIQEVRKAPTNDSIKGDKKLFSLRSRNGGKSSIPRFVGKKKDSRVSTLARHFEQLSREFEKERKKDERQRAAKISHSRAFLQRSSTKAIVQVYEDPNEAVHEPGPSVEDSLGGKPSSAPKSSLGEVSEALTSDPIQTPAEVSTSPVGFQAPVGENAPEADSQTQNTSQVATDDEQADSDTENSLLEGTALEEIADSIDSSTEIPLELPKQDKMNFMKVLSNFWAERSASEWPPLDYPLNATDHIFIDSDIIVREDEPSSLIAFALSCDDYKNKASKFHGRKLTDSQELSEKGPVLDAPVDASGVPDFVSDKALEASFTRKTSSHLKYQFIEGSARMLVKIFYAEQFDALRRKCGVADRIVESLSRCLKFDSRGGKTKSVFLKTQDDRLMMKSLSTVETSAFLRFAPSYFGIMAEALFRDMPTVIAKMLGFFQVIIKNPVTNTEIKLDLLLMENLFYDRAPTRIFDLKGSMRNRKIQSTGEQNEVLLDENMVEFIYESPLFAREHSKNLLGGSVFNDTLFLARQNVMDYSLMVAVDEAKKELVVGIIDCIRTYTWDKTLESWIKARGFAGGGRNRPTVTSPKEYKYRFREAMSRYILQAPNCWHLFNAPYMTTRPHYDVMGDEQMVMDA